MTQTSAETYEQFGAAAVPGSIENSYGSSAQFMHEVPADYGAAAYNGMAATAGQYDVQQQQYAQQQQQYAQQQQQYAQQQQQYQGQHAMPMGTITPEMVATMSGAELQQLQMNAVQSMSAGFNSIGLPIRDGSQICSYFANYGECKFGPQCKYSHPEEYAKLAAAKQEAMALAAQGYSTGLPDAPVPTVGSGAPTNYMNSLGYPLRPGQVACSFFSRTGTCRYASTCKWDHPEEFCVLATPDAAAKYLAPKVEITGFNTKGYPLRTGAQPCTFYLKTGTCKFGTSCKWDHPEGMGGSMEDSRHQGGMPQMPMIEMNMAAPMMHQPITDAEAAYAAVTSAQSFNRPAPY